MNLEQVEPLRRGVTDGTLSQQLPAVGHPRVEVVYGGPHITSVQEGPA